MASVSETLIFINDLGSQHLQLISGGILREILRARTPWRWYTFYPIISSFQSNHLIMGSSLYGLMGSRNTQVFQESAPGPRRPLRVTKTLVHTKARLENKNVLHLYSEKEEEAEEEEEGWQPAVQEETIA